MYNAVTTVNNIVLYIWKLPREQSLEVLITKKKLVTAYGDECYCDDHSAYLQQIIRMYT